MKDQNSYNLNGLRAVFWGMLLGIISNFGTSGMTWLTTKFSAEMLRYIGLGFAALTFIGFLMIIIGLTRVGKYSYHFRRSRNYYLWSVLLVIIAFVLVLLAYWFVDHNKDSSGTMLGTVGMVVAAMALIVAAGWLGILKIKQMMNGCADIARQNEERHYAARCTRAWVYYMFFSIVTVACVVVLAVVAVKSLFETADTTGGQITSVEDMAGGFKYFFHVAGGLGVSLILLFFSYLLVMGKVNGTLMRYHRVEIPAGVFGEEEEIPAPPVEKEPEEPAVKETPEVPVPPAIPEPAAVDEVVTEAPKPVVEPAPAPETPIAPEIQLEPDVTEPLPTAEPTIVEPAPVVETPIAPEIQLEPDVTEPLPTAEPTIVEPAPAPETPIAPEIQLEPDVTEPLPTAEPTIVEPAPVVETVADAPETPAKASVPPMKQAGGKHAKPAGYVKQAGSKHAAPRKAQSKQASIPAAPKANAGEIADSEAPNVDAMPTRDRNAETRTIEMEKSPQITPDAPDLFEEGMAPKGFDEE